MQQSQTVEFLSSGRAFARGGPVRVVQTHGAYVFLCGDTALKLKRAVTYDYMDLGTVGLRHAMLVRELELNRPAAPEIYRDLLPVTHGAGGLELGGSGPVVDWVLRMWRFAEENEFEAIVARGAFDDRLAQATGVEVARYHARSPVVETSGRGLIAAILAELERVFSEFPGAGGTLALARWHKNAEEELERVGALLDARGAAGHIRRGHGDLHLRNLVLIGGRPVLYDALEFDETLGTCDVLYDVGFLLMDLSHRGLLRQACRVLDAWLRETRGAEDAGLAALPLFLSVRAAIRAMVLLQTDAARDQPGASVAEIGSYLDLALVALRQPTPVLVAVGGYSGSGKSVLARALAPSFRPLPGAVCLSSDLERKVGQVPSAPLAPHSYTPARREAIYNAMLGRAETLLRAGQSVILDATFTNSKMREAAAEVAARAGVCFHGLWLTAPERLLSERIAKRAGDASDANVAVLRAQLAGDSGAIDWNAIDTSGTPETARLAALEVLGAEAVGAGT